MKINCGPSPKEIAEMISAGTHPRQQWRKQYALFPVRVGPGDCRWFEYIMIRDHRWASWGECGWEAEYASMEDFSKIPVEEFNKRYDDDSTI